MGQFQKYPTHNFLPSLRCTYIGPLTEMEVAYQLVPNSNQKKYNRTPHNLHNFSSILFFVSKELTSYKIIYQTTPQVVKTVLSSEKERGKKKKVQTSKKKQVKKKQKRQTNFLLVTSLHSLKAPPKNIYTTSKPTLLLTLTLPLFLAPQRFTNPSPGRSTLNLYEICYSSSCTPTKAYINKPYFLKPLL